MTADWAHTPAGGKSVRPLKASAVYAYLLEGLQLPQSVDRTGKKTPASKDARQKAEVHLHAVVDEMLKKPNAIFYAAEWNNQDDTNMFAVIAVSTTTYLSDVSMLKVIPAI